MAKVVPTAIKNFLKIGFSPNNRYIKAYAEIDGTKSYLKRLRKIAKREKSVKLICRMQINKQIKNY